MSVSIFDNEAMGVAMANEFRIRFETGRDPSVSLLLFDPERFESMELVFEKLAFIFSTLLSPLENYVAPLIDISLFTKDLDAIQITAKVASYPFPLIEVSKTVGEEVIALQELMTGLGQQLLKLRDLAGKGVQATMDVLNDVISFILDFITKFVNKDSLSGVAAAVFNFFKPVLESATGLLSNIVHMLAEIAGQPVKFAAWLSVQGGKLDAKIREIRAKFAHRADIADAQEAEAIAEHEAAKAKKRKENRERIAKLTKRIATTLASAVAMVLSVMVKPILFIRGIIEAIFKFLKKLFLKTIPGAVFGIILEGKKLMDIILEPIEDLVDALLGVLDPVFDFTSMVAGNIAALASRTAARLKLNLELDDVNAKIKSTSGIDKERWIARREKLKEKLAKILEAIIALTAKAILIGTAPVDAITGAVLILMTGIIVGIGIPISF
jgi:hypothetical protein